MKKICVIALISLLLLFCLDYIGYRMVINNSLTFVKEEDRVEAVKKYPSWFENRFRLYDETTIKWFEKQGSFREPVGLDYKKAPVWMFGCSFVYGVGVQGAHQPEDTFGYIYSQTVKRPVYNRAYPSWGVQHMLYQLKKGEIFDELPKPEYVIFNFISDHARRTQKLVYDPWSDGGYLRYKVNKEGKLEEIKPVLPLLWKFYPVKLWLGHLEYNIRLAFDLHDENFDLLKKMFIESRDILNSKYPDTKFVILLYNGNDGFDRWFIETDRWKELEQEGFIVIRADEITGKNLQSEKFLDEDGYHPNPLAWKFVSEELAKLLH